MCPNCVCEPLSLERQVVAEKHHRCCIQAWIVFVCWGPQCRVGLWNHGVVDLCPCARLHLHRSFAGIWALKRKVLGLSVGQQVNGLKHTNAKTRKSNTQRVYLYITPLWQRVWQHKAFGTCTTIIGDWKSAHGPHPNRSSSFPHVSQVKHFWHYETNSTSDVCVCARTNGKVSPW